MNASYTSFWKFSEVFDKFSEFFYKFSEFFDKFSKFFDKFSKFFDQLSEISDKCFKFPMQVTDKYCKFLTKVGEIDLPLGQTATRYWETCLQVAHRMTKAGKAVSRERRGARGVFLTGCFWRGCFCRNLQQLSEIFKFSRIFNRFCPPDPSVNRLYATFSNISMFKQKKICLPSRGLLTFSNFLKKVSEVFNGRLAIASNE